MMTTKWILRLNTDKTTRNTSSGVRECLFCSNCVPKTQCACIEKPSKAWLTSLDLNGLTCSSASRRHFSPSKDHPLAEYSNHAISKLNNETHPCASKSLGMKLECPLGR